MLAMEAFASLNTQDGVCRLQALPRRVQSCTLVSPVGVFVGIEATRFLSATGVGLLIAVASGTFLYCALPDFLHFISPGFWCSYVICRM